MAVSHRAKNTVTDSSRSISPTAADAAVTRRARWGVALGILCWLLACIPTGVIVWQLADVWQSLSAAPSHSIRPVGLWILGLKCSGVNLLCTVPLAYVCATWAERLGSKFGADLAVWSVVMSIVPIALAFFGPFVIVPATGSSFGT